MRIGEPGPKYPDVSVRLVGEDGNAFAIMGKVMAALREAGAAQSDVDEYYAEATDGDYDNLLRVTMAWVEVSCPTCGFGGGLHDATRHYGVS